MTRFLTAALLALVAGASVPATQAAPAPRSAAPVTTPSGSPDQLRAQRAALVAQLNQVQGPADAARSQLAAAEQALLAAQDKVAAARKQLDEINGRLQSLSARIMDDRHSLVAAKSRLGELVRATYEANSNEGFTAAVLSAGSFTEAMDRIRNADHITAQVTKLQAEVDQREASLIRERKEVQDSAVLASATANELQAESNRLTADVATRDAAFQQADAPARAIAQQIADIDQALAPPAGPVNGGGPCGNHFAFGYCTWYVATRRCIPWFGDAYQWYGAAQAAGFQVGHSPAPGAVVVWGQGGGMSSAGHVAYVESVNPDGSFLISEMNGTAGWDQVDQRTVSPGAPGIIGFIYGHA